MRRKRFKTMPEFEAVDIRVTAKNIPLILPFVRVERVISAFRWEAVGNNWIQIAGSTALNIGIQFAYNGVNILPFSIKNNFDLVKYSHDVIFNTDTQATKNTVMTHRLSFDKFSPGGYDLTDSNKFEVVLEDDLSSIGEELILMFEGYKWKTRL